MTCIEAFLNKPVLIQLNSPIAGVVSQEAVEVDGEVVGRARVYSTPAAQKGLEQAFPLQFIQGAIEEVDETSLIVVTLGVDGKTPVRFFLPRVNVGSIAFCPEHVPAEEPSRILTPGS